MVGSSRWKIFLQWWQPQKLNYTWDNDLSFNKIKPISRTLLPIHSAQDGLCSVVIPEGWRVVSGDLQLLSELVNPFQPAFPHTVSLLLY